MDPIYTRVIPKSELDTFLSVAKQLDALTDQLGNTHRNRRQALLDQIANLRAQRDDIARRHPFKAV